MSTPHNNAEKGQIAKTVLMPGDPLRAKFIAETFLENPKLVSSVRNVYAYTGTYNGKEISVMASGMGMPSIGIYSYELYSESSYAKTQSGDPRNILFPSEELNDRIRNSAKNLNIPLHEGMIHSSDVFYRESSDYMTQDENVKNSLCVEMESFALFHNAEVLGKKAACLLTISDSFVYPEVTTPEERQKSFTNMMKIALDSAE